MSVAGPAAHGRVIVVDDELELMTALCELLEGNGYSVHGCSTGREALEAIQGGEFDIILTDLMMPEVDGIRLLRSALEMDPQLVGIVMTGQGTVHTAVEAMKVGAFDYILKPFKSQTLFAQSSTGDGRATVETVKH